MSYMIFDPKVDRPLHLLSREGAEKAYERFFSQKGERAKQIRDLIGIVDDINSIENWFVRECIKERDAFQENPSPYLLSISNDLAILLAEVVIDKSKGGVFWALYTNGKNDLSYHRPVIMGFSVENKKYNVDFDRLICQYAVRLLKGGDNEKLFNRMLDACMLRI